MCKADLGDGMPQNSTSVKAVRFHSIEIIQNSLESSSITANSSFNRFLLWLSQDSHQSSSTSRHRWYRPVYAKLRVIPDYPIPLVTNCLETKLNASHHPTLTNVYLHLAYVVPPSDWFSSNSGNNLSPLGVKMLANCIGRVHSHWRRQRYDDGIRWRKLRARALVAAAAAGGDGGGDVYSTGV